MAIEAVGAARLASRSMFGPLASTSRPDCPIPQQRAIAHLVKCSRRRAREALSPHHHARSEYLATLYLGQHPSKAALAMAIAVFH